jgi:hypothetical protein
MAGGYCSQSAPGVALLLLLLVRSRGTRQRDNKKQEEHQASKQEHKNGIAEEHRTSTEHSLFYPEIMVSQLIVFKKYN